MQYKVLALDLDGTLTNNAKVITPRTKAALQAAADRGVRIVLASGRPTVGIEPLAKELELDRRGGCILSYNGGKIIDCKTGETLVQHEFPPELIDPVCTFARYWNVMPLTYDAKGIVTEDAANPYVGEEARINKIPARQVENLPAEIQWPINKLLLVGDPVDMPHVEELMQQKFAGKLSIYRSAPFFIETMPLGVEKSASLALLLKNMGLGPENLMACGDGWNDLPMIRYAGMGVAMGNAVPEVKQAAKYPAHLLRHRSGKGGAAVSAAERRHSLLQGFSLYRPAVPTREAVGALRTRQGQKRDALSHSQTLMTMEQDQEQMQGALYVAVDDGNKIIAMERSRRGDEGFRALLDEFTDYAANCGAIPSVLFFDIRTMYDIIGCLILRDQ